MDIASLHEIIFSPTGTSRRIARAIAEGISPTDNPSVIDLTTESPAASLLPESSLAVIVMPVYGGKTAPLALERFRSIKGCDTPAIVVAVYGNRAYDKAVEQLSAVAQEQGFIPIGAAAFIGEHSYSTPCTPIAAGRPDENDLAFARAFGRDIRRKLSAASLPLEAINPARLKHPSTPLVSRLRFILFVLRQRRRQKRMPANCFPTAAPDLCIHCGKCVRSCPTGAIPAGEEIRTREDLCIKCCACVKGCPQSARSFDTPFAPVLSRCFSRPQPPVVLL